MKAIVYTRYGPPDVLQMKEVQKPRPGDNEILVRIYATAVSATDPISRKGDPFISRVATGLTKPKFATLGTAFAGEIEAIGTDVTLFRKGNQVYGSTGIQAGAHAEYACLPADGALALMPDNLTYEEAAAIPYEALTALPFLRDKAKIQRGHSVLINGASGSIGTSAVQLAHYFGAEVTGVCSTVNVDLVRAIGADHVIDYTIEDFTQTGRTYDIIFDTVGKSSFAHCKGSLKPGGVYLLTVPTVAIMFNMLWTARIGSKRAIFAATGLRSASEKSQDLYFLTELVEAGEIRPVIDRRYPLERTVDAHRYVEKGHKKGTVVITVAHDGQPSSQVAPLAQVGSHL